MSENPPGVEVVEATPIPEADLLPAGVRPSVNYTEAVELGRVLAASGYYRDARDPAKAAVKVMIGLDLGISPTAALQGVHHFEDSDGKSVFLIEGKLLAALVKMRPGYDYRFLERGEEKVSIEFVRDGEALNPPIEWTMDRARKAGLTSKRSKMYEKYAAEMLTWRAIAEGVRVHFPELLAGQPVYVAEEFNLSSDEGKMAEALDPSPKALDTPEAEEVRLACRSAFEELREVNPRRIAPGRFTKMVADADHSLERLESVKESLEDLRDTEGQIADLTAQAEDSSLDKAGLKVLLGQVERCGSNAERIEVLEENLRVVEEQAK